MRNPLCNLSEIRSCAVSVVLIAGVANVPLTPNQAIKRTTIYFLGVCRGHHEGAHAQFESCHPSTNLHHLSRLDWEEVDIEVLSRVADAVGNA